MIINTIIIYKDVSCQKNGKWEGSDEIQIMISCDVVIINTISIADVIIKRKRGKTISKKEMNISMTF